MGESHLIILRMDRMFIDGHLELVYQTLALKSTNGTLALEMKQTKERCFLESSPTKIENTHYTITKILWENMPELSGKRNDKNKIK